MAFFQGGATAVETTDMDTRLNFTSALLVNWPNKVCFLFFFVFFLLYLLAFKGGSGGAALEKGCGRGRPGRCTRNASLDNEQAKLENVNSEFYPVRCFANTSSPNNNTFMHSRGQYYRTIKKKILKQLNKMTKKKVKYEW